MLKRLRKHLSYANVTATLALFLALSGGMAWALANDSVKSRHIVDEQVRSHDVRDESLRLRDTSPLSFISGRNPGSINDGACATQTESFDLLQGDRVIVTPPSNLPAGFTAYGLVVDSGGSAQWRICNFSGEAVDPPGMTFQIFVERF
jgi:hypothetical protein